MPSTLAPKDRKHLPDNALPVAEQIKHAGFGENWTFDYQYPLPDPEKTQRLQVRGVPSPTAEVAKYQAAMKRGDVFPPGVVTKDGRFVDLNTRAKAAWNLGQRHYPVFILDVSYDSASDIEREQLLLLGAAFNTHGPKPLSTTELTAVVRHMGPEWTAERIAEILGVTNKRISSVFAQRRAELRAERLGIHLNGSVSSSNRVILGQRNDKLTDRPFEMITRLVQDAGLTGRELQDLCNRVQAVTGSDDEKLALITEERMARENQIIHFKATKKRQPPMSSEMLKRTRYIEGFADNLESLIDYNPNTSARYLASLEHAVSVLKDLVRAQREATL